MIDAINGLISVIFILTLQCGCVNKLVPRNFICTLNTYTNYTEQFEVCMSVNMEVPVF